MDQRRILAELSPVPSRLLPKLCARLTHLTLPHLPSSLVDADSAIAESIRVIGELVREGSVGVDLDRLRDSLNAAIDRYQEIFEAASCLPIGEALVATLEVARYPNHAAAAEAIMAVYTAVEMQAFMSVGPGDGQIRLISADDHIAYMKLLRESGPIKGFERILDREMKLAMQAPG